MTHTKWSPVSTAYYRLEPHIEIKEDILNADANRMKELCPVNVFDTKGSKNKKKLVVKNQDGCTFCRACINDEKLGDKILLAK